MEALLQKDQKHASIGEDRSTRQDLRLGVKALEQVPPQMNSKKEVEVG